MNDSGLSEFCNWLAATPLSHTIQSAGWIIPALQTIHILSVAVVFSSATLVDLRIWRLLDRDVPLPEIARELGVDAIIEGSVVRAGDQVRITAQLIYAPTDKHLWAKSYDRDLRNVLALPPHVRSLGAVSALGIGRHRPQQQDLTGAGLGAHPRPSQGSVEQPICRCRRRLRV